MTEPLISIIITNYNYSHFIREAIESAINQDYPNKEIIIVDDGSTDDSISVIMEFDSHITLISKENGGVSTARNVGIERSSGEYLAFLDADDYWDETKLSKQQKRIADSGHKLVYCKMRILDENGETFTTSETREGDFRTLFLNSPGKTPFPPSSVLMTKSLVNLVGKWDVKLINAAEDFDFFRRCSKHTEFAIVPEPLVTHREHENSLTVSSLKRYYKYNSISMLKMYNDVEMYSSFVLRRINVVKFQFSFAKSFFRNRNLYMCSQMILLCFLPLTCLEKHSKNIFLD
jgi:glycosyltransferase involved in cell wall biosynthesis